MKINDIYDIRIVVIEIVGEGESQTTGAVYHDFGEFKKSRPYSGYKFGYVVYDTEYNYVPGECNPWNETIEEALLDFIQHCARKEVNIYG